MTGAKVGTWLGCYGYLLPITSFAYHLIYFMAPMLFPFLQMSFQRCARTDKGVSAARQVVSLKMSVLEYYFTKS